MRGLLQQQCNSGRTNTPPPSTVPAPIAVPKAVVVVVAAVVADVTFSSYLVLFILSYYDKYCLC